MKRKIVLSCLVAALMFTGVGNVFAQNQFEQASGGGAEAVDSYADTKTFVYEIEDKYGEEHPSAKNVKLSLEFTPLTGDVRFFYECLAGSYDQGEAMNTAKAVFLDISKELNFKHYSYKAKDKTRYFKSKETNQRMAEYSSFVNFTN